MELILPDHLFKPVNRPGNGQVRLFKSFAKVSRYSFLHYFQGGFVLCVVFDDLGRGTYEVTPISSLDISLYMVTLLVTLLRTLLFNFGHILASKQHFATFGVEENFPRLFSLL